VEGPPPAKRSADEDGIQEESPGERWDTDRLTDWLRATRDRQGAPLESHLRGGSLEAQLRRIGRAYRDGAWGFELPRSEVSFRASPERLERIRQAIDAGAVNGILIEAYPTPRDLNTFTLGDRLDGGGASDRIADMTVCDFLAGHFARRGGRFYGGAHGAEVWRRARFPADGRPLWRLVRALDDPAASFVLPPHPRLGDVLGSRSLSFTNVAAELPADAAGRSASHEGASSPWSLQRLLDLRISPPTPAQFLALVTGVADPADPGTYPSPDGQTWEWLSGLSPAGAMYGRAAAGGLIFGWNPVAYSGVYGRARPVL
jgi:hypothetical protein